MHKTNARVSIWRHMPLRFKLQFVAVAEDGSESTDGVVVLDKTTSAKACQKCTRQCGTKDHVGLPASGVSVCTFRPDSCADCGELERILPFIELAVRPVYVSLPRIALRLD